MKPNKTLAAILGAAVLLGVLAAFAIELSNTQAHNRADVRARVHERAVLAASLIDGLFNTVTQEKATYQHLYGGAVVKPKALESQKQTSAYVVVMNAQGRVLATSTGITEAEADVLARDSAVRLVRSGQSYGLGNVVTYRGGSVLNFAVPFPTAYGERIVVSGAPVGLLGTFLQGDLRKIPSVAGARNYVIDGNGVILASTAPGGASGGHFSGPFPSGSQRNFDRDTGSRYYDEVRLSGSNWRIVLASPDGPLYASVSGVTKWVPWILFGCFALLGGFAFLLVGRVLTSAQETRTANAKLDRVNRELAMTNAMLEERAAELARSNEELDQFASIASHDLQEPLRKVRTFTQELMRIESDSLSEKGRDYVARANAAAQRMQTLIEDLLKFSRVSTHAEAFTAVDLDHVVEEVLGDLSQQIERTGATAHVGTLPAVDADPLQMRQLFQNLISNALKFHAADAMPEVWIEGRIDGGDAHITVRDNGIGFDPRYAGRIFRVFERLHGRNEYPGTGIGLALCRKIVERHGGSIVADSAPGEGATFTVTLPLHPTRGRPPMSMLSETAIGDRAHV